MKYKELLDKKTGMYVDWQLDKLPKVDTIIDIGVGEEGTQGLYDAFPESKLILIDPRIESKACTKNFPESRQWIFFPYALGSTSEKMNLNIYAEGLYSSFLEANEINFLDKPSEVRSVEIKTLDSLIHNETLESTIGIKIDTEGFELEIIKGAAQTLTKTEFVIAEVRHNHESLKEVYHLHEFMNEMTKNGFTLTNIFSAKPFIADLVFRPNSSLFES